jgi:hypothetical protein
MDNKILFAFKNNTLIFLTLTLAWLLSSCAPTEYFQVYKASPKNAQITKNSVDFENAHCIVSYNLLTRGGNPGFSFFNKTNDFITIQLDKTFFIRNSEASPYFLNRTYSYSYSSSASVAGLYTNGISSAPAAVASASARGSETSFTQTREIMVPPLTQVTIQEYAVSSARYRECDYLAFPSKKDVRTLKFNEAKSPIKFSNLITYESGNDTVSFETAFFVEEITNYPSSEATIRVNKNDCGKTLYTPVTKFRFDSPNYFFLPYYRSVK